MTKHIKLVTRKELAVVKGLCYMTWNLKQLWQNWKRKKSFTENLGEIPGNQSDLFMKDLDRWTILNDPYHHNNSKSKHLTDSNFPLQMLNFLHRYGHNEWLTKTLILTISFFSLKHGFRIFSINRFGNYTFVVLFAFLPKVSLWQPSTSMQAFQRIFFRRAINWTHKNVLSEIAWEIYCLPKVSKQAV